MWKVKTNTTLTRQKHYLKGRLCLYETDIGKTFDNHTHGFKTRMNSHH